MNRQLDDWERMMILDNKLLQENLRKSIIEFKKTGKLESKAVFYSLKEVKNG